MSKPLIVLICGKAGHGKTTFAEELEDTLIGWYGYNVQHIAFADAVKQCCKGLGWNGKKDERGRNLLQKVGHTMRVTNGENYWIECTERNFDKDADIIIISDARYMNEFEYFEDELVIKVNRPHYCNNKLTTEQKMHASELEHEQVTPDFSFQFEDLFMLDNAVGAIATYIRDELL